MKNSFTGFPAEAFAFFRALKRNNRREWFQPRKPIYEQNVKAPMVELVAAIEREMMEFAPEYVNGPDKAIYRIYRDTRFSQDKTPYKTHIAAVFPRLGLEKHCSAGFYFSVAAEEVAVAGGVYMPGREQLLAIRTYLAEHYRELDKIRKARHLRSVMGEMQGDRLSRMPKGFSPGHPAADLLRYKQFLFYVLLEPSLAITTRIASEVVRRFRAMTPFVNFLNRPLIGEAKKRRSEQAHFAAMRL